MRKRTLVDRMIARDRALVNDAYTPYGHIRAEDRALVNDAYTPYGHIRAELDRLARQVRKLKDIGEWDRNYDIAINDVLALIKEAKQ